MAAGAVYYLKFRFHITAATAQPLRWAPNSEFNYIKKRKKPMPTTKQIRELGRNIILKNPDGIRFADIVGQILAEFPGANKTTVVAQVANHLVPAYLTEITKPSRGLYKPLLGDTQNLPISMSTPAATGFQREEDVYEPFAQWLKNDIEEATEAVSLGGVLFQ